MFSVCTAYGQGGLDLPIIISRGMEFFSFSSDCQLQMLIFLPLLSVYFDPSSPTLYV